MAKKCAATPDCFGDNELFHSSYRDGFRFHYRRSPEMASAVAELLPDPDRVLASGKIIKPGTRTHAGQVVLHGKSYFLKRYNCRGPWYRLRHLFKQSRAIRTWSISRDFFAAHVPIPEPLACLEARRFGFLGRSYILMENVEAAESLRVAWPTLSSEQKSNLLEMLAVLLGKMHAGGRFHGDLKWDNILLSKASQPPQLTLVDLDGSGWASWRRRQRVWEDISRFVRDLEKYESDRELHHQFLDTWRKWAA